MMKQTAHPESIVDTDWVAEHGSDSNVRLVEVDVDRMGVIVLVAARSQIDFLALETHRHRVPHQQFHANPRAAVGIEGAKIFRLYRRLDRGDNPPETCIAEVYEPPSIENPNVDPMKTGSAPRGIDVDRNGVIWTALSGSGHLASFDRSKCMGPLNGPTATGQHCPEGWTLYTEPAPQIKNLTESGSAESSYYTWVDQFNTLGLGAGVPISTGNGSEGLLALKDGEWVVLRVPYPLGFYTKWMDGRIDDPNAGWKGRGLWATHSTRAPFHLEGGKGTTSKVVHFQLRPDPLGK